MEFVERFSFWKIVVILRVEKWSLIAEITSLNAFSDFGVQVKQVLKLFMQLIFFKIVLTEINFVILILGVNYVDLSYLIDLLRDTSIYSYFLILLFSISKIVIYSLVEQLTISLINVNIWVIFLLLNRMQHIISAYSIILSFINVNFAWWWSLFIA